VTRLRLCLSALLAPLIPHIRLDAPQKAYVGLPHALQEKFYWCTVTRIDDWNVRRPMACGRCRFSDSCPTDTRGPGASGRPWLARVRVAIDQAFASVRFARVRSASLETGFRWIGWWMRGNASMPPHRSGRTCRGLARYATASRAEGPRTIATDTAVTRIAETPARTC